MQQDDDKTLYATMRPARSGRSLVTLSTYEERQEALRHTAMMEDEVNHRASRLYRNDNSQVNNNNNTIAATTTSTTTTTAQFNMPPPPPQFASSPPQQRISINSNNNSNNSSATAIKHNIKSLPSTMNPKPPSSPVPDYDNIEIRTKSTTATATSTTTKTATNTTNTNANNTRPSYGYATPNVVTNGAATATNGGANRRTMRLGTVTIGEYEQPQQRKEPAKFDFVGTPKRNSSANAATDESLHTELQNTLTRSKLKKSAEPLEHQSNCPLRSGYENYESVARKLHNVNLNEGGVTAATTTTTAALRHSTGPVATNGILKNGNSSRNSHGNGIGSNGNGNLTKNSDKTITFGN